MSFKKLTKGEQGLLESFEAIENQVLTNKNIVDAKKASIVELQNLIRLQEQKAKAFESERRDDYLGQLRIEAEKELLEFERLNTSADKQAALIDVLDSENDSLLVGSQQKIDEITAQYLALTKRNLDLKARREIERQREIEKLLSQKRWNYNNEVKRKNDLLHKIAVDNERTIRRTDDLTKIIDLSKATIDTKE